MFLLVIGLLFLLTPADNSAKASIALQAKADVCHYVVRVRDDGVFVTYRFSGWRVTSPRTLESDVKAGYYNDANPSTVTSVTIEASPVAPKNRLGLLYAILGRNGWPKEKVASKTSNAQSSRLN